MGKRIIALLLIICLTFPLTACQRTFSISSDKYFGTYSKLDVKMAKDISKEFDALLKKLNLYLSATVEDSDVDKFNKLEYGQSTEIHELTFEVLNVAKTLYEITDGYYDPTVYPLVDLWGFTPRFKEDDSNLSMPYDRQKGEDGEYPLPNSQYIALFKQLVDFEKVVFYADNGKYYLKKDIMPVSIDGQTYEAKLDLGGLAKGFACQKVMELVKENKGVEGYFSCGGSSISVFGKEYVLAIKNPRPENIEGLTFAQFPIQNLSISTSGDYENYYFLDGKRYCHVINAKTGYPIKIMDDTNIVSATLLGDNSAILDGLSTAIMCMEENEAVKILNSLNVKYVIVKDDLSVLANVPSLKITNDIFKMG